MKPEEIKKLIDEINDRIKTLEDFSNSLKNNTTMPLEIGSAMKERLNDIFATGGPSAVTPASETVTIAGSDAAKPMTGFITITFGGNAYNIPYYT